MALNNVVVFFKLYYSKTVLNKDIIFSVCNIFPICFWGASPVLCRSKPLSFQVMSMPIRFPKPNTALHLRYITMILVIIVNVILWISSYAYCNYTLCLLMISKVNHIISYLSFLGNVYSFFLTISIFSSKGNFNGQTYKYFSSLKNVLYLYAQNK